MNVRRNSDVRERVLRYLRREGQATASQVAEGIGVTPSSAREALRRLREAGQVQTIADARQVWMLAVAA